MIVNNIIMYIAIEIKILIKNQFKKSLKDQNIDVKALINAKYQVIFFNCKSNILY